MRKFFITIDTEGDNLWEWREGALITTKNACYLQRFQNLCNKYGFIPVWLTNWEMLNDETFVTFVKQELEKGTCEVGMHIHAWNNPPGYELEKEYMCAPYLIEYPKHIMEKKIDCYLKKYDEIFGKKPIVHRAGRWAMNDYYFEILKDRNIMMDCSVTPYISWEQSKGQSEGSKGPDYSKHNGTIKRISGVYEIPMTIIPIRCWNRENAKNFKGCIAEIRGLIKGKKAWLRPNGHNFVEMKKVIEKNKNEYLMFMLHSSELMPGGSPTFKNASDIEKLYVELDKLFKIISKEYEGITFEQYLHSLR